MLIGSIRITAEIIPGVYCQVSNANNKCGMIELSNKAADKPVEINKYLRWLADGRAAAR